MVKEDNLLQRDAFLTNAKNLTMDHVLLNRCRPTVDQCATFGESLEFRSEMLRKICHHQVADEKKRLENSTFFQYLAVFLNYSKFFVHDFFKFSHKEQD